MTSPPGEGVVTKDVREYLLLAKERFFQAGISPEEFRRTSMRDIRDVMDIQDAWSQKAERERKINEAVASMK